MADTGATYPTSGTNDTSVGTVAWTDPSEITDPDVNVAYAEGASFTTVTTNYLKGLSFGFDIPGGATINGVLVEVNRSHENQGPVTDNIIRLVVGGVVSGTNKSAGASWNSSPTTVSFGGSSDLWGLSLTESDVENVNFGIVLACDITSDAFSPNFAYVAWIRMTVYYTASGGWTGKVTGVTNPASVDSVLAANISKVIGVS